MPILPAMPISSCRMYEMLYILAIPSSATLKHHTRELFACWDVTVSAQRDVVAHRTARRPRVHQLRLQVGVMWVVTQQAPNVATRPSVHSKQGGGACAEQGR